MFRSIQAARKNMISELITPAVKKKSFCIHSGHGKSGVKTSPPPSATRFGTNKVLVQIGRNTSILRRDALCITGSIFLTLVASNYLTRGEIEKGEIEKTEIEKDEEKKETHPPSGDVAYYINTDATVQEIAFNNEVYYAAAIARKDDGTPICGALKMIQNPAPPPADEQVLVQLREIAVKLEDDFKEEAKSISKHKHKIGGWFRKFKQRLTSDLNMITNGLKLVEKMRKAGAGDDHYMLIYSAIEKIKEEINKGSSIKHLEDIEAKLKVLKLSLTTRIRVDYTPKKSCDGPFEAELLGVDLALGLQLPNEDADLFFKMDNKDAARHINQFRERVGIPLSDEEIGSKINPSWAKLSGGKEANSIKWGRYMTTLSSIYTQTELKKGDVTFEHADRARNKLAHECAAYAKNLFNANPHLPTVIILDERAIDAMLGRSKKTKKKNIMPESKKIQNIIEKEKADPASWR